MALPPMQPAEDAQRVHEYTYFDGTSRTLYLSARERVYPRGRLIVSRTDLKGIITHANDAFVEISGYSRDELLGQPHCILRHPDMPKAAYRDVWETLGSGRKWHGYVKNLCKDGTFYWVYATAVPNVCDGKVVGYASVRREPSRRKVEEMSALYEKMLLEERAAS